MLLTLLSLALGAAPSLRSVVSANGRCAVLVRQAPDWKPRVLAERPVACDGATATWAPDGTRALVTAGGARLLLGAKSEWFDLPALPGQASSQSAGFGVDGAVYALTSNDVPGGEARAWVLEQGAWKLVETVRVEEAGPFGAAAQLKTARKLFDDRPWPRPARAATAAELAVLQKVPLASGFSWVVAQAGASALAWQLAGNDACSAFAPVVVLTKRPVAVPPDGWPADRCRNLSALDGLLLVDNATTGPGYRAALVDLATGAVLVELPRAERAARIVR